MCVCMCVLMAAERVLGTVFPCVLCGRGIFFFVHRARIKRTLKYHIMLSLRCKGEDGVDCWGERERERGGGTRGDDR